ncbi:putative morc, S5 domain 2 protein [Helianthus anomalus]
MRPLSFPTCQHIPPFKKSAMEISGKRLHPHLHLIRAYKSCRFMLCMIVTVVTMGFVEDVKAHIDVQGFIIKIDSLSFECFYKQNFQQQILKSILQCFLFYSHFWRLWNSTGSDSRGVIGVLEANFEEPAHDKQRFECTIVLSRLETRLIQMQNTYRYALYDDYSLQNTYWYALYDDYSHL